MRFANFHHSSSCAFAALTLLLQLLATSPSSAQKHGKDPTGTSEPTDASAEMTYFLEEQHRAHGFADATTWPDQDRGSGSYWRQFDTHYYTESENYDDFNSAYLNSTLDNVPWIYRSNVGKQTYTTHYFRGYASSGAHEAEVTNSHSYQVQYSGHIMQTRLRLSAASADHPRRDFLCFKIFRKRSYNHPYTTPSRDGDLVAIEPFRVTLPSGQMNTNWIELKAPLVDGEQNVIELIPMYMAPDVLPVNSDFDEGRIDPVTGYAIPDCDDSEHSLEAVRDHLDGDIDQGELVTDDMHPGFFGVHPLDMPYDFWTGANVTIRKLDKIDPDTGHPESGHIRMYAKWGDGENEQHRVIVPYDDETLEPVNLITGGVHGAPSESAYRLPTNNWSYFYYIEGVHPGKVTLEWRYQKGGIDIRHEQSFLVETRQTLEKWREEVRYQIRLQTKVKTGTEVDIAQYHPGDGFRNPNPGQDNLPRVNAIYEYYQQLFKEMPEKFMWAGMAKVAAAPIFAGMSDLNTWWQASEFYPPWPPFQGPNRDFGVEVFIEGLLLSGQKAIFNDKAWAHRAFKASGIGALDYLADDFPRATNYNAWSLLNEGILENSQTKINEANGRLLRREQEVVVQENYDIVKNLRMRQPPSSFLGITFNDAVLVPTDGNGLANAGEWLSANSNKNPIPGGPGFRATIPLGRLDFFNDRWAWTSNAAGGMLEIWTGASTSIPSFNTARRASENEKSISNAAAAYSYDPSGLPN